MVVVCGAEVMVNPGAELGHMVGPGNEEVSSSETDEDYRDGEDFEEIVSNNVYVNIDDNKVQVRLQNRSGDAGLGGTVCYQFQSCCSRPHPRRLPTPSRLSKRKALCVSGLELLCLTSRGKLSFSSCWRVRETRSPGCGQGEGGDYRVSSSC